MVAVGNSGNGYLSKRQYAAFVQECLRQLLALQPKSLNSRVLYELTGHSLALTAAALAV